VYISAANRTEEKLMEKLPSTLEESHEVIRLLLNKLDEVSKRMETLEAECKRLSIENTQLKERLNNNSSNSSTPPSKSQKKKKNNRQSSGKASGGQAGHKGHYRALLPSHEVDTFEKCRLPKNCICGGAIKLSDDYQRHQVYELPVLKLQVTEYQLQKGCCKTCSQRHVASLPVGVTWGIIGPRLTGFMSELVTKYGLSRREQKAFLEEQFQFSISLGTVFNKQKIVNAAMKVTSVLDKEFTQ
jgi:transposase